MANFDDNNELRGALEKGLAARLNILLAVFTRQNAVVLQKDRPRVEILVAIGAATGAKRAFPDEGIIRFVRWNFAVTFTAITAPASALTRTDGESDADFQARVNANNTLHSDIVAALRNWAATVAQASWTDYDNFPNHFIAEALRDSGSPSALKPEQGYEQTALGFSGVVGIRESAWTA